ncbi:hypothetical protein BU14_0431s0003 [Porphyra umbilicalis]|uniref:Uncharacterized protein n=1 Tax=Porphyra umbilicalis TaxID=2786 RepID=A0A1X6NV22_PORUM|nr:hypothetical protein BU14_0431s0003 [Porphyra umbilicalis]|eukprot:OSX72479.1 hypothetical protein BU14_0431s0003 [Porphyra umbilicalis]
MAAPCTCSLSSTYGFPANQLCRVVLYTPSHLLMFLWLRAASATQPNDMHGLDARVSRSAPLLRTTTFNNGEAIQLFCRQRRLCGRCGRRGGSGRRRVSIHLGSR